MSQTPNVSPIQAKSNFLPVILSRTAFVWLQLHSIYLVHTPQYVNLSATSHEDPCIPQRRGFTDRPSHRWFSSSRPIVLASCTTSSPTTHALLNCERDAHDVPSPPIVASSGLSTHCPSPTDDDGTGKMCDLQCTSSSDANEEEVDAVGCCARTSDIDSALCSW